jgi:hypothetical protein
MQQMPDFQWTSRVTRDITEARGMSAPTKQIHHFERVDLQALGMRRRTGEASRVIGTAKSMLIAPNAIRRTPTIVGIGDREK